MHTASRVQHAGQLMGGWNQRGVGCLRDTAAPRGSGFGPAALPAAREAALLYTAMATETDDSERSKEFSHQFFSRLYPIGGVKA